MCFPLGFEEISILELVAHDSPNDEKIVGIDSTNS